MDPGMGSLIQIGKEMIKPLVVLISSAAIYGEPSDLPITEMSCEMNR